MKWKKRGVHMKELYTKTNKNTTAQNVRNPTMHREKEK